MKPTQYLNVTGKKEGVEILLTGSHQRKNLEKLRYSVGRRSVYSCHLFLVLVTRNQTCFLCQWETPCSQDVPFHACVSQVSLLSYCLFCRFHNTFLNLHKEN